MAIFSIHPARVPVSLHQIPPRRLPTAARLGQLTTAARHALLGLMVASAAFAAQPERRAIDYLSIEVPRWSKENGCFSCHNDGDGARALFAARPRGLSMPALEPTLAWLAAPKGWDKNRGIPAASDKKLARIQFAAALAAAVEARLLTDRRPLIAAAESLLPLQEADGSWVVETGSLPGSPVTYGAALATFLSRETLAKADARRFAGPIRRATEWLRRLKPETILDRSAMVLAGVGDAGPISSAQTSDGGWGPYPGARAEPFDTAVALLALQSSRKDSKAIARGRDYLIRTQLEPGGWPATTRPSGADSYAQHISTTAWALLALLSTDPERH